MYDALDTEQWEFYVVRAGRVRAYKSRSVGIAWVRQHAESAEPLPFSKLAGAIAAAANWAAPTGEVH
jgi:hypothetical protein